MYIIYTNNFQAPSDILKGNQSSIFFFFISRCLFWSNLKPRFRNWTSKSYCMKLLTIWSVNMQMLIVTVHINLLVVRRHITTVLCCGYLVPIYRQPRLSTVKTCIWNPTLVAVSQHLSWLAFSRTLQPFLRISLLGFHTFTSCFWL